MPYADPEKRRAARRRWYKKNREKVLEQSLEYRKSNPDKFPNAGARLDLTDEQKAANIKASRKKAQRACYERCKAHVRDLKEKGKCKECGEDHPATLVFHHRDPKKKEGQVSRFYKQSLKRVKEEIAKCEMLCHNCHHKLHWEERENEQG